MSKIKKIYTFGTSQTAGGGFEFESVVVAPKYKSPDGKIKKRGEALKLLYKDIGQELTQYNFSWPGQLQKVLNIGEGDTKVTNLAKSGYGNERMYRLTYDLIRKHLHELDSILFIYEFSYLGRKEFYLRDIDDYVIVNYAFPDGGPGGIPELHGVANEYFFDENPNIYKNTDFFKEIIEKTINFDNQLDLMRMNQISFLSFLKTAGVNFLTSSEPWDDNRIHGDLVNFDKNQIDFYQYTGHEGNPISMNLDTSIAAETEGAFFDGHNGIIMNNFIGGCVYNELIDRGMVSGNKLSIHRPTDYTLKNINLFF